MARLPRRLAPHLGAGALALLASAAPARAAEVDIAGTWHVLVHYTDANSASPQQPRWDDRVWIFERKGSRLAWIEYPIVVFDDETGRFERRGTGQYARVLGAWEPDEAQLADIADGLKINHRGSKTKSLRGSDAGGWATTSRARPGSASVITFDENWSIEGLSSLPVFVQEDVMGSGRSETMEGVTRYETTEIDAGGGVLRGLFERDSTRKGRFTMRRAGEVGELEEKTQEEIQAQAFRRGVATSQIAREEALAVIEEALAQRGLTLSDASKRAIVDETLGMFAAGKPQAEIQSAVGALIAERVFAEHGSPALDAELARRGAELSDAQRQELVGGVAERVRGNQSNEAIEAWVRTRVGEMLGESAPAGSESSSSGFGPGASLHDAQGPSVHDAQAPSVHDADARYRFPFSDETPRQLLIGAVGGTATGSIASAGGASGRTVRGRKGSENTLAFAMPPGSEFLAARAGRVVEAGALRGESVAVLHSDGTLARYWPLDGPARVAVGQEVEPGAVLGEVGHGRGGSEPMLMFGVFGRSADGRLESIPVRFEDGSPEGLAPAQGNYFKGQPRRPPS